MKYSRYFIYSKVILISVIPANPAPPDELTLNLNIWDNQNFQPESDNGILNEGGDYEEQKQLDADYGDIGVLKPNFFNTNKERGYIESTNYGSGNGDVDARDLNGNINDGSSDNGSGNEDSNHFESININGYNGYGYRPGVDRNPNTEYEYRSDVGRNSQNYNYDSNNGCYCPNTVSTNGLVENKGGNPMHGTYTDNGANVSTNPMYDTYTDNGANVSTNPMYGTYRENDSNVSSTPLHGPNTEYSIQLTPSQQCITLKDTLCLFPFKDGRKVYNSCKKYGKGYWCATSITSQGEWHRWAYCNQTLCPLQGNQYYVATKTHPSGECFDKNIDYPGNNINLKTENTDKRNSAAECQALCSERNGCEYFTWKPNNECLLKNLISREFKENGSISGPKKCNVKKSSKWSQWSRWSPWSQLKTVTQPSLASKGAAYADISNTNNGSGNGNTDAVNLNGNVNNGSDNDGSGNENSNHLEAVFIFNYNYDGKVPKESWSGHNRNGCYCPNKVGRNGRNIRNDHDISVVTNPMSGTYLGNDVNTGTNPMYGPNVGEGGVKKRTYDTYLDNNVNVETNPTYGSNMGKSGVKNQIYGIYPGGCSLSCYFGGVNYGEIGCRKKLWGNRCLAGDKGGICDCIFYEYLNVAG